MLRCPACSGRALKVEPLTVRALIKPGLEDKVAEETYLYCPSPSCDVVYSSVTTTGQRFLRSDVRVRVGEKESAPPIHVCYCFDWTVGDIQCEIERSSMTSIPERIKEKIKQGFCHCETMNPRGICCLGAVNRAVEVVMGKKDRALSSLPLPSPPANCVAVTLNGVQISHRP
jgi:hypothetical protein